MKKSRPKRPISSDTPLDDTPIDKLPKAERARFDALVKQVQESEDLWYYGRPGEPVSSASSVLTFIRAHSEYEKAALSDDALEEALPTASMIRLKERNDGSFARPATKEELKEHLKQELKEAHRKKPTGERRGPKAAALPSRLTDPILERYMSHQPHHGAPAIKAHFERLLGEPVSLRALYANPVLRRLRRLLPR